MTEQTRRGAGRWWRSHSVRVRLTLWYVAAMMIVLGVYVFGVYTFVSRNVSDSLDERLRADFYWAAATVDEGPDGLIMPFPADRPAARGGITVGSGLECRRS